MATLAKLMVQLGFDDQFSAKFDKAGEKLTKVGQKWSAAVTLPLVGLATYGVKAATDLNEAVSATGVVFGTSAADIEKWASGAARNLGISKTAALTAANQFGALGVKIGLTVPEAVQFSEAIVQSASDLGSFYNVDPGTVLEDLQSGLAGQSEPLRKYNIYLNETAVAQKAMEMSGKANADQLTESEKVAARYQLIMEQLGPSVGDFARTSDQTANSMRIANAEFHDAAATLGQQFLPKVTQLANAFSDLMVSYQKLSPEQQRVITGFGLIAAVIGPLALVLGFIITNITAFGAALGVIIAPITAFIGLLVLWNPIIAPVSAALIVLKTNVFGLGDAMRAVASTVKATATSIKNAFTTMVNTAVALFLLLKTYAVDRVGELKDDALATIGDLVLGISAWLDVLETYFSDAWDNVIDTAGTSLGTLWANVITIVSGIASDAYSNAFNIGYQIGNGIIAGINSIWSSVVGYAESLASAAYNGILSKLHIKSPSQATEWAGEMLGAGLIVGMENSERAVAAAAGSMSGAALTGMGGNTIHGGMTFNISGAGDPRATANEVFSIFAREMALTTGGV